MPDNTDTEPTFVVNGGTIYHERTDTEYAGTELIPQFAPSALGASEREQYDSLRDAHRTNRGAIVLKQPFRGAFEDGEELTIEEIKTRHREQADAVVEALREPLQQLAAMHQQTATTLVEAFGSAFETADQAEGPREQER